MGGMGFALTFWLLSSPRAGAVDVLTQHNDLSRDGANLQETMLTPANVNANDFGELFTCPVDGQIYAQPLYVQGLSISNQSHNVVFVCTESNSVYAFDADNGSLLWHVNLGTPVPAALVDSGSNISPLVGITSTPVIDTNTGTIYVEAKTTNSVSNNILNTLHALSLTNGSEKFGGPTNIQATVGGISFNNQHQLQRPGLLLLSNVVYLGFGSHQDSKPYNGWLIGYNATNLAQVTVFNTTPASLNNEGALWSCGMAPAADTNGNIYVMTGNGTFDANSGGSDYGQCFLKLSTTNGLAVADWFAPWNANALSSGDKDIGSGGPVLLPGSPPLVIGLGKFGTNYVLNSTNFGHFTQNGASDTNIIQEFAATPATGCIGQCPVYWNGPTNQFVYLSCGSGYTTVFSYTGTNIQTTPLATGSVKQGNNSPGGVSLSANGNTNGILWVIDNSNGGTLRAYNAAQMPTELWDSTNDAARDAFGEFVKFCSPTIANGKVYVPGSSELVVYGLLPSTLIWTSGSGSDNNWSTALNWTNVTAGGYGPPGPANNVVFNATGDAANTNSDTSYVNQNFTIAALQYTNYGGSGMAYHTTDIPLGNILTVTNGLLVANTNATENGGAANLWDVVVRGQGALLLTNGGSLVVACQESDNELTNTAVLNLSGLATFMATNVSGIFVGVSGRPVPTAHNANNGTLILAQTNFVALSGIGEDNSLLVGNNANNTTNSFLYLGQTNVIFADAVDVGNQKSSAEMLFQNGLSSPAAYFRGADGTSRVSYWGIADYALVASGGSSSCYGTNDFTGGSVDATIGSLNIGVGGNSASATGALNFSAGTIDANTVTNGWSGTSTGAATGVINVLGSATLKVNTRLVLAQQSGTGTTTGTLNINGGVVLANSIIAGSGGTSTIALNGGTLIVTNTASSGTLAAANSTLHLNLNGASVVTNIVVGSLIASGVNTIAIDSAANVSGVTNFPLIAYNSFAGSVAANFVKGALPAGFSASLVNNSAQDRIDLVIAPSTTVTPRIGAFSLSEGNLIFSGSNGLPNGTYYVLVSTNVALPLGQWTPIATNPFDSSGNFMFTNPINPNSAQLFYLLQLP